MLALVALSALAVAGPANAVGKKTKIDTPVISCGGSGNDYIDVQVCAASGTGATGLPAGFSIHWTTKAILDANGGIWPATDSVLACGASFAGNANLSRYNLLPGQCVTVRIGEILLDSGASTNCPTGLVSCTQYVFQAFGHATSALGRSDNTANLYCSTTGCDTSCDPNVKSFGYWKTHYPDWPADVLANGMTVGCQFYTADQLESILSTTPAGGNELVALAHQVINARLNILNGAGAAYVADVSADLAAAEALMCTVGAVPPVGTGSLTGAQAGALTLSLDGTRGKYECP